MELRHGRGMDWIVFWVGYGLPSSQATSQKRRRAHPTCFLFAFHLRLIEKKSKWRKQMKRWDWRTAQRGRERSEQGSQIKKRMKWNGILCWLALPPCLRSEWAAHQAHQLWARQAKGANNSTTIKRGMTLGQRLIGGWFASAESAPFNPIKWKIKMIFILNLLSFILLTFII